MFRTAWGRWRLHAVFWRRNHESGMDGAGDINPSEEGAVRAQKCKFNSIEGLCLTGLQNQK
jgi:hypothetical protein